MGWKPALVGTAALAAVLFLAMPGYTGATTVPISRAGYHRIVISGAQLLAVTHTTSPGTTIITGSDVAVAGNHKNDTLQEQFGGGALVTCQFSTQAAGETHFTCTGLNQSALASSTLTITLT